jgi:flavin-dependent dehydrogenase
VTARAATQADVLVVGGGPAGLATAIELALRNRRVTVVDRGTPVPNASMLLSPRAVASARRLGVDLTDDFHPIGQVRISAHEPHSTTVRSTSTAWPRHRVFPDDGVVARRDRLVDILRSIAVDAGVDMRERHEATEPLVERGFVRGARVRVAGSTEPVEVRGGLTVVADGAGSQFGRMLGTFREPEWPAAQAYATEYPSPLHGLHEAEVVVGITDRAGIPIAGYGWMFPTGGGTVSVGVMLMSTSPSYQVINPAHLLDRFVEDERERWRLDGPAAGEPTGARIPLGMSVGPLAGPTWLIIGDAAAAANPLTGFGIDTALETGIIAGDVIAEALDTDSPAALQQYPQQVNDRYGSYYKVGRLTDRVLGRPSISRRVYAATASHRRLTDGALRIANQHLRTGARGGGPEMIYRMARAISVFAPDA